MSRLVAFCLFLCACVPARAETIILAADVWCPYTCEQGGYMVDIATEIFAAGGVKVEYRIMPWAKAIDEARAGRIDGIIGATHADAKDFIFPQSLQGISDMRFWVQRDSGWSYDGPDSLEGQRLGIVADYAYSKTLDEYIRAHADNASIIQPVKGEDSLLENLNKLKRGELDVVAEDDNVVNYFLISQSADFPIKSAGSVVGADAISDNFLYVALSPANPKSARYAAMLDAGMDTLRATGELQKILDLYHVNDWRGINRR